MKPRYVIIGAGPAGLTAGFLLTQKHQPVIILEKADQIGGLSKTVHYKKYRFDLGPHRFFTASPAINQLWQSLLGKDLITINRQTSLLYQNKFYDYPLIAQNALANLGFWSSLLAIFSFVKAKITPRKETSLEAVYINSFGHFLYQKFFKHYSTRLWGLPPSQMAPDWGKQRVGSLSLFAAIKDAFLSQKSPKSLIKNFHYPRFGPGQMWNIMAHQIKKTGQIFTDFPVQTIHHQKNRITRVLTAKGKTFPVSELISTMALQDFITSLSPPPPSPILKAATHLNYRDFILVALVTKTSRLFPDQWIYIQDPGFQTLRIFNMNNWSQSLVPDKNQTVLGLEYTVDTHHPLWQKSNQDLIQLAQNEVIKLGFAKKKDFIDAAVKRELKAYPVYDLHYQTHLNTVKNYLARFKNLALIGRNGMHRYNNIDHSMLTAILAVENLFGAHHNIWQVNTDSEYFESALHETDQKPSQY